MHEMRDSGIEWIGTIPTDWEIRKVKAILNIQTGFTPDTKNDDYYSDDGVDWVTIGDLDGHKYIPASTKKKISHKYIEAFAPEIVPAGSLLYSFKLSVGQTAFTNRPVYTNEAIASFLHSNIYSMQFLRFASFLIEYNANTNIYGAHLLNQELIKNALIVVPPIEQQKRIATFLDVKFDQVDTLIANVQEQIEKLKAYKQSVITEVVTKGLDPTVPMKDSGVEWIGEIPENWSTIRVKQLLRERKERSVDGSEEPLSMSQKVGLVPTKMLDMIPNMASSFVGAKLTYVDDLVFNKLKAHLGVFSVSKYDGLVSPDYAVYYSTGKVHLKYLEYLFKTPQCISEFRKRSTGIAAGLTRLYTDGLFAIECPFPTMEEQMAIIYYLNEKCTQIDQLIAIKQKKIDKLNEYKKSLVYEYVTGKREVS